MTARRALLLLLLVATAQALWNASAQRAFWGYDEGGHAGYALAIREQGLPDPLSGWSSFHPPLAHALGAALWTLAEPLGPRAALTALRLPSLLGMLALLVGVFALARRTGASEGVALAAAAVCAGLPVVSLAASMIGNEALAAGLATLALVALAELQRDPGRVRLALAAGICAGLAAATKYTGLWSVACCALPWLRRDLDRRALRAGALCALAATALCAPVYLRNLALTGSLLPMTREREPMRSGEALLETRPRELGDYLRVPWDCGSYPYVTVVAEGGLVAGLHPSMQSVPCLVYAGVWFDPFGLRATRTDPREGLAWGVLLLYAGLAPTLLTLAGAGALALRAWRSRGRGPELPLLALCALGLGSFVAFSWLAPSLAAAKSSYLLPLAGPAGAAFAQGCALLPRGARRTGLALSLAAAALAAYVFTTGSVFAPGRADVSLRYWTRVGELLPESRISEAARRLLE